MRLKLEAEAEAEVTTNKIFLDWKSIQKGDGKERKDGRTFAVEKV
jgi:hypothetical protein